MKRLVVLLLTAGLLLGGSLPAQAKPSRPERFLSWMDQDRSGDLVKVEGLSALARRHSRAMSLERSIWHSSLDCYCGEIVGIGFSGRLRELYRKFMESRTHRAVILNPAFSRVGIGIRERDGLLYVTAIFA